MRRESGVQKTRQCNRSCTFDKIVDFSVVVQHQGPTIQSLTRMVTSVLLLSCTHEATRAPKGPQIPFTQKTLKQYISLVRSWMYPL